MTFHFPVLVMKTELLPQSHVRRRLVAWIGLTAGLSVCLGTVHYYCITEVDSLPTCNSLPTNNNNCHTWFSTALRLLC